MADSIANDNDDIISTVRLLKAIDEMHEFEAREGLHLRGGMNPVAVIVMRLQRNAGVPVAPRSTEPSDG